MSEVPTKRCSHCGEVKDCAAFAKNAHKSDGLQHYCRPCASKARAKYAASPKGRARMRAKSWAKYVSSPKGRAVRVKARIKYRSSPKGRATANAWQRAHPEKGRATEQVRRARKRAAEIGDRETLSKFASGRWYAEAFIGSPVHLDHVQALAAGGAHAIENLRWLPAWVNVRKGAKADHDVSDPDARAWLIGPPTFEQVTYITRRTLPST